MARSAGAPSLDRTLCVLALVCIGEFAGAAIVSRTISVDGDMSDWAGIQDNPGQFSTDAEGTVSAADRDYVVQATGRDLERFSFTFDADNLYLYVRRYASTSNRNDWWFYLDTDADGAMADGEPVFHVRWQGANGTIERKRWRYDAAAASDPLVDPQTGFADGYDMPGTNYDEVDLDPPSVSITGGAANGVEMEVWIAWSDIGFTGPRSLGFHIASSNGQNLPNQIDDNMDGPLGNFLVFADLALSKTPDVTTALGGDPVTYAVTATNAGDDVVTNVEVLDDLAAAGLTYLSDDSVSSGTVYDPDTGRWSIPSLPGSGSITLNVRATAQPVVPTSYANVARIVALDQIDPNAANDAASADVTFQPGPDLTFDKSLITVSDPTGATNPKTIPGARVDYMLEVENTGAAAAETVEIIDALPPSVRLYVDDLDGGPGPVEFIDGDGNGNDLSGLGYTFVALSSTADDVDFSANGGADFLYVPVPDASGFDGNVTHVRLTPSGQLDAAAGGTPRARFRMRVELR